MLTLALECALLMASQALLFRPLPMARGAILALAEGRTDAVGAGGRAQGGMRNLFNALDTLRLRLIERERLDQEKAALTAQLKRQADRDELTGFGGEEFAVVLLGPDPDRLTEIAERMRRALQDATVTLPTGTRLQVTASFGLALAPRAPACGRALSRRPIRPAIASRLPAVTRSRSAPSGRSPSRRLLRRPTRKSVDGSPRVLDAGPTSADNVAAAGVPP